MALMSRRPIEEVPQLFLTDGRDYNNWKTRKALAITLNIGKGEEAVSFVTAHMGWWKDEEEPFSRQWERLDAFASSLRRRADVWLMGDFNTQDSVRGEGYDQITASGWTDTVFLFSEKPMRGAISAKTESFSSFSQKTGGGSETMPSIWQ